MSIYIIMSSGCANSWDREDAKLFIDDCIEVKGTLEICGCMLRCLEKEYDTYSVVLKNIENTELSKELKRCVNKCKN